MTTPAVREHQSPLEDALLDVHTTLAELLVAADEQHAAVVARDRDRLESVTRQQERLSARLARAESRRIELLAGESLAAKLASLPPTAAARAKTVGNSITTQVKLLKERQAHTASLLQQSIDLTGQALLFLQRLVAPPAQVYGARGLTVSRQSLMLDSRA
jgi:flagellar biosynthesis/type III secretory pathway chaperone